MIRMRLIAVALSMLIFLMIGSCGDSQGKKDTKVLALAEQSPRFILEDLQGNRVSSEKFAGGVTVLSLWTTWCRYCSIELKQMEKLYHKYKNKGVNIIGISFDKGGAKTVLPFVRKANINFPILMGNSRFTNDFGGIRGFPTTLILDQSWRIHRRYVGLVREGVIERDIKSLLAN